MPTDQALRPAAAVLGSPVAANSPLAARRRVVAYDVSSPRTSARLRRLLLRWCTGRHQRSVYETHLDGPDLVDLVARAASTLDEQSDLLAVWQPWQQQAVWLTAGSPGPSWPTPRPYCRHWMVAYDIAADHTRDAARRTFAPKGHALQRSVFTVHGSGTEVHALFQHLSTSLGEDDSLAAWPLRSLGQLWTVGEPPAALLPSPDHPGRRQTGDLLLREATP